MSFIDSMAQLLPLAALATLTACVAPTWEVQVFSVEEIWPLDGEQGVEDGQRIFVQFNDEVDTDGHDRSGWPAQAVFSIGDDYEISVPLWPLSKVSLASDEWQPEVAKEEPGRVLATNRLVAGEQRVEVEVGEGLVSSRGVPLLYPASALFYTVDWVPMPTLERRDLLTQPFVEEVLRVDAGADLNEGLRYEWTVSWWSEGEQPSCRLLEFDPVYSEEATVIAYAPHSRCMVEVVAVDEEGVRSDPAGVLVRVGESE